MTTSTGSTSAVERAGFAAEGVFRIMSFGLACAGLLLAGVNISDAFRDAPTLSPAWTAFSIAAATIPPIIALGFARAGSPRALRRVWTIGAFAMLAAFLTAPLGTGDFHFPAQVGLPWVISLSVVAACSAAITWRPVFVVAYGVVLELAGFTLVLLVRGPLFGAALGNAVEQLFIVALFMCLAITLVRAGRVLDATVESVVKDAQDASAADMRRAARQRVEMLIHDSVIVALFSYSNSADRRKAVAEAERALTAIDGARGAGGHGVDRAPLEFAWELQALATQLDPAAAFEYRASGAGPVPADAANAIIEATSEALRNSIRHAPTSRVVSRQLRVEVSDDDVEVLVLDDGEGFDTGRVNPSRMGVRSGIVGRLRGIPGGSATVSSRLGYGTTVAVRWRRP